VGGEREKAVKEGKGKKAYRKRRVPSRGLRVGIKKWTNKKNEARRGRGQKGRRPLANKKKRSRKNAGKEEKKKK